MTDFENLTAGLLINDDNDDSAVQQQKEKIENPFETKVEAPPKPTITKPIPKKITNTGNTTFFSTEDFQRELRTKSIKKNKAYQLYSENISAYDIASGCSRSVFYRINNVPTNNYANKWLPVEMRCTIGSGVHDFIQDNYSKFTEQEVCLKVPSRRLSTRLDCLINDNVLVEIKTCAYSDMADIIKTGKPRIKDFYQIALYKYLLENHLEEAKQQAPTRGGTIALLDEYNIEYFQFIYVCHELLADETESMSEAIKYAKNLKKLSGSKKDPFWFIQTINVDLRNIDMSIYEKIIVEKLDAILYHLNNNKLPELDSKFIDKGACFFCIHSSICKEQN
jgi:hypothetical protein